MSNAVATVAFLQGQAWAKAPDGSLRPLSVGSTLNADEILVTAQGAQVQLDFGNGEPVLVNGGLEVAMSRDFSNDTATDPNEAALNDASVQEALTVLEQGGDLLEELEETAAGNNSGGGSDGSNSFVTLTRVLEETDSQSFNYQSSSTPAVTQDQSDGAYINRAPEVTDQTLAGNEDDVINGQIIAADIEGDAITYTLATAPANGALVLDATTGQFTFTPNANYNGSDGFVVTVTDSRGNASTTTVSLNIAAVNDAPTTNNINLTTDEDTPVAGQVVAQDIEGDILTYTVSGQPANGNVTLNPATGAFVYTPGTNFNGGDSFVVTISDGNGGTITSLVSIGVNPVNDAPVSNDQALVTDEDTPVSGQVVASDVDGDTLGYTLSSQPANGTVTLNPATGGFVYTPNANYNGSDSFVVTISDGNGGTTTSTISIGVTPVNDAPVSNDQNLSTPEDTPVSGAVVASDVDGDTLSYAISGAASNGSVTLDPATGAFVYTPNANYNGSDSFVVTISDGNGGTTTSTITIGVTPVNDAPVSSDQNLSTPEDTPVSGAVVATDVDGDTLSYAISGAASNGSVTLNPSTGAFVYTPNANFNGSDSFVVTISDGNGGITTSTISIGVTPVNDAPVSSNLSLVTPEDTPVSGQVSASDIDGDTLSYAISGAASNGSVTLNPATGAFVYTPNANFNGSDSFVVTISDGNGGTTTSLVSIGVTPVNDAPVARNLNLTTDENVPVSGIVRASDADGDTLAFVVTGAPANGSVTLNPATGSFVYTPKTSFNGSDSFTVTISDGKGGTTTSLVTIGVTPVNDVPVTSNLNLTTDEDTPINGAVSATDPDGDPLSFNVSGNPTNGTVVLNPATGTFTYTPTTGFSGSDSFVVTVSDGNGGTVTSTVTIGVNAVNYAPTAADDTVATDENTAVTIDVRANDIDPDGDLLTVSGVTQGANGSVVIDAGTGNPIYTPNAGFVGTDSFTYTIDDGSGTTSTATVTVKVNFVNDAPVAVADSITVAEGGVATALNGGATSLLANDTDAEGDPLVAILVSGPANGTLTLNPNGTFSYIHNGSETTTDSFTYKVNDGTVDGNTVTVNINVTPVNDAPITVADSIQVAEGGTATVLVGGATSLLANDSDAESHLLTAVLVTGPANGTLTLNANGTFSYVHNGSETTTDSFTYRTSDGITLGNIVTVTINVTPVNTAPVAVTESITLLEGGVATSLDGGATSVLANDTDAEGNPLTAILVSGPAHGTLTLNANGTFSYTHDGSETTIDSFTYKVNDGTVDGNTVTVNINVTPVNEKPIAVDDYYTTAEDTPIVFNLSDWLANDSDPDGDTIAAFSAGAVVNGTLSYVGGQLTFTPNAEYSGPASFKYSIHDGHGNTATATVHITVTNVDDPSLLMADTLHSNEDTVASGNVLLNDSDVDSTLQVVSFIVNGTGYSAGDVVSVPGIGSLTLQASGAFAFTPVANYNGPVPQVTYTTNTGYSSTLDITIDPVNDAPVANNDSMTATKNVALEIKLSDLTANDTDIDGHTLTVFAAGAVTNGSLAYIGGKLHFIPAANYTGPASFNYSITDGHGATSTATVNITVTGPANVVPVTNDVTANGNEDTLISISLSGSDSDGSVAGYVIKSLPANGVLYSDATMTTVVAVGDLVTGPVYFMPAANWNGSASFTYATRDNEGAEDSTPATVTINVVPVADPALLGSGSGNVKEDTPAQTTASGTLTITDADSGEASFTVRSNSPGTYGHFSIDASGNWTYTIDNSNPAVQALKEGETRSDSFSVTSLDGTSTTVVITVTGTNDGPVAVADTATVNQDAILSLTPAQLLVNDSDLDGDTLSISSVQDAVNGSVSLVGGNVVFTPTPGYFGPASFTYTVSDGKGGSATASVSVTVVKPNTAPDAVNDNNVDGGASNLGLHSEFYSYRQGTDGPNLSTLTQVQQFVDSHSPTATFTTTNFNYNPGNAFNNNLGQGTNLQTFLGTDAASLSADPGNSSDAIIRMRGFVELNAGTYNFRVLSDDGYQIRIDGVTVAQVASNQNATTTTHTQFTIASSGIHTIEILYWDQGYYAQFLAEISDNSGATYQPFSAFNSFKHASLSVVEDTALSIPASSLLANDTDADGDTLQVVSVQGAVNGSVALVGGNVIFTPAANYVGAASFTYTISDGRGGTDTATVKLVVSPVNDAPTAVNDSLIASSNTSTVIQASSLLANDTDVDGDVLQIVSVQGAVNGTVSLLGTQITFTPTSGYEGPASFTYTLRDNSGVTSTATVNLAVGAANAASVVVSKAILAVAHGTGGTSVKFPITTKLVDTDGSETLSIKVSGVPTGLSFNAGTNLGGGVWQFTQADLPNLTLNLPGSYTTNATHLTVQVTSTEASGGFTASTSTVVTVKAAYTTVDIITTESGAYTGSSANEFIQGGAGNNTINAASGNNVVYGGAGNDTLSAGGGSDIFFGGSGNDTINAGSGTDRISGGSGNDSLIGGDAGENFVDVFVWSLGDQEAAGTPAVDTISNFSTAAAGTNTSGGDVLDLRDLLQGESVGASNGAGNLADYLHFEVSGGNTIIHISHTGGFAADSHSVGGSYTSGAETQQIVLSGVNLQSLYSGATTDQQIITQLLNNNKLITD